MHVTEEVGPKNASVESRLGLLIQRLERRLERAERLGRRFVRWRLTLVLTGIGSGILLYQSGRSMPADAVVALFAVGFLFLVFFHSRLKRRIDRLNRWIGIKRTHLARRRLDWRSLPNRPSEEVFSHHPYALDLDLVGTHSLIRLLDTTVSTRGRRDLTESLLFPKLDSAVLAEKQRLVRDLIPRSLLRDRILLQTGEIGAGLLDGDEVDRALRGSGPPTGLKIVLTVEAVLAFCTAVLVVLEVGFGLPRFWPLSLSVYAVIYFLYAGNLAPLFDRAQRVRGDLEVFRDLFSLLEKRVEVGAPTLEGLLAPFRLRGLRPSDLTRRLARVCDALSVKGHLLVHLGLNAALPWDLWFSSRFSVVRAEILEQFSPWMEALGRLEGAAALAQFAALHPEYVFSAPWPEEQGRPLSLGLQAQEVGHPLIPRSKRICNDLQLDGPGATALLTGSNMSGKSTFLRAVGVNVCLAQAGGPVCARHFSAPMLRVQCSLRVEDNLEEGLSTFYAEVKRLRQILEAVGQTDAPPVLFLIDEIFRGTNNRERIIGSTHYLKALVEGNGLGLVTTHDLELVGLSGQTPRVINYHFQETVSAGELVFDYRLRPGPCPTTNALRIMALEGLPVPEPNEADRRD